MQPWAIGIDVGGTKLAAGIVTETGEVQRVVEIATHVDAGPEGVRTDMVAVVRELLRSAPCEAPPVGVGIGVAGQIDARRGIIVDAPNLDWHDVELVSKLQSDLGLPVAVTNDVQAAAWGEWLFGAGRDCDDFVCVFVGTGIGGGVVTGGRMMTGADNTAGEVGHMTVAIDGDECRCGNRGCWETLAGGYWLGERARRAIRSDPAAGAALLKLVNGDAEELTAEIVISASDVGDHLAKALVDRTIEGLIAGAVSVVNGFNPRRLILGGGMIAGLSAALPQVERGIRRRALGAATRQLEVVRAQLGANAGVIGSAAFALRRMSPAGR